MYKTLLHICWLLLLPTFNFAQDFNYIHYDTKDGLAGSTVYDLCQDKDGFMWFATENGLARYDGTSFRTFTVKDGLPDNEVLKVFGDSKGRVWIGTFNKAVCYYYNGKIYNAAEDSLLRKLQFNNTLATVVEVSDGTIGFNDLNMAYYLFPDGRIKKLTAQEVFLEEGRMVMAECQDRILLSRFDRSRSLVYSRGSFNMVIPKDENGPNPRMIGDTFWVGVHGLSNGGNDRFIKIKNDIITYVRLPGAFWITFICSNNGCLELDTVNVTWKNHFLPGKKVSNALRDKENNVWFSTYGEGIYKLPSTEIKTIAPKFDGITTNKEAFSILGQGDSILAGFGFSKVVITDKLFRTTYQDFTEQMYYSGNAIKNNRLYAITQLSSGELMLGFDGFLAKLGTGKPLINYSFAIKSIAEINKNELLVGTSGCALILRSNDLVVLDTIWRERATKVFFHADKYYIGTINGLYEIDKNKTARFLGTINNSFSRRITDMKLDRWGALWVSTSDNGILSYKDGKVEHVFKDTNGLSSNICRTLWLQDNFLWVGTNAGLNKIDISKSVPVVKYSISDGLPSDVINGVYVKDSIVWVASPAGITYFNENNITNTSLCILKFMGANLAGTEQPAADKYDISYRDKNIRFNYVAISFKSGGEILYNYRMVGLSNDWQQTMQTSLDYQSLPPGSYTLQIYAVNKFGKKSDMLEINIRVDSPFWKTWWFYALLVLFIISITFWLVNKRNSRVQRKLEDQNRTQQQFAALEQQALQAQMNPHFIFNCLNSIQQYILTNDKQKANEYLTGFASLVRQTLDNSGKRTITVVEEANYLDNYLRMEKMRFGDNFEYSINIHHSVKADFIEIPALLLQPYVENSLRHGIRYKKDHSGRVDIDFIMKENVLICSIKDNGIGRKKAAEYKSQQHIEYQSKGMSLTQKRILLLNKVNETTMKVEIKDLTDRDGNPTGTEVIIEIPI